MFELDWLVSLFTFSFWFVAEFDVTTFSNYKSEIAFLADVAVSTNLLVPDHVFFQFCHAMLSKGIGVSDWMSNDWKAKYPAITEFASVLYSVSPRAYNYARGPFQISERYDLSTVNLPLPGETTVKGRYVVHS